MACMAMSVIRFNFPDNDANDVENASDIPKEVLKLL